MFNLIISSKKFIQENHLAITTVAYIFLMWVFISIIYNIQFVDKKFKVEKVMVIEKFNGNKISDMDGGYNTELVNAADKIISGVDTTSQISKKKRKMFARHL